MRDLSVLVDGTAVPAQLGGVGRYLEGLVPALADLVEITIVVRVEHVAHFRAAAPRARVVAAPKAVDRPLVRFAWEQVGLPLLARRLRVDVLHSPHYTFPFLRRRGSVVTLHDATFFSDPQWHGRVKQRFFRWWSRRALRSGRPCITPSSATAAELRRHVPGVRQAPVVAHLGVDRDVFRPPAERELREVREELGLPAGARWLAFLGTIEPRKNVGELLRAHAELRRRDTDVPVLVVAGGRGWDDDAIALLESSRRDDGVIEAGYLPLPLLHALLGGAEVVVYPSSGEGFGLPVLEAMSTGACVLTTDRLSLPEVGGAAVAYCAPKAEGIADALHGLLADGRRRADLRTDALERAAGFTWEATAAAHLPAYREAVA